MITFPVPTDWKSAKWWQNRPKEERLFHTKIPKRLSQYLPLDIPDDARHWLSDFTPGENLFIQGKSGTGKSVLAAGLLARLVTNHNLSGRFVASDTYIEMLKDQFDNDNLLPEMYSTPYLVKYVQGVFDVVVLDGLGQERETEFASHELGTLIRRRYHDMNTIIITSSMGAMDITRRYGDRVAAAINDMTVIRSR